MIAPCRHCCREKRKQRLRSIVLELRMHFLLITLVYLPFKGSVDQLRRDFNRIKQQYGASVQKAARLEQELNQANSRIKALESKGAPNSFSALSEELCEVRSQLAQKTALLDKVKTLLQRAAAKERGLQEEVSRG